MRLILAALFVALSSQAMGQDAAPVQVAALTPDDVSVSIIAAQQFVAQVAQTDPQCSRSPLVARLYGTRGQGGISILDASAFSRSLVQPPTH
jgi:hypothetical protein